MAIEPVDFDAKEFINKYHIQFCNTWDIYSVWEIAEEASRGGRFGEFSDSKLVLQLVSRGGMVIAELNSAIKKCYKNWKLGHPRKFNICRYVTSGMGSSYCAARRNVSNERKISVNLQSIYQKLNKADQVLLYNAYRAASNFIESKAACEELHSGSGFGTSITYTNRTKKAYVQLIENIYYTHENPKPKNTDWLTVDKNLNYAYEEVIATITEIIDQINKSPEQIPNTYFLDCKKIKMCKMCKIFGLLIETLP